MSSKLIGAKVYITDKTSVYFGEWGIVKMYDGENYHVAIANGGDSIPVFQRQDFKIRRTKEK